LAAIFYTRYWTRKNEVSKIKSKQSASLILRFEAGHLFIQFDPICLDSVEQAESILASSPMILIRDSLIYLDCPHFATFLHSVGETLFDECGHWAEGADKEELEDYLDALITVPELLAYGIKAEGFKLAWFSIQEYVDRELQSFRSGYIDRLDGHQPPSLTDLSEGYISDLSAA
jgi:hypothetical protein